MKHSLIILALILGTITIIASCKKSEEVKIEEVKEVEEQQADAPEQSALAGAMKKAAITMRRLSRAVGNNNWVEVDMWTNELKEGIGFSCVTLYMIETPDVSEEFSVLSNKFNSAINKLIMCGKRQDRINANLEFDNLVESCDACHESFNKDMEGPLDFTDTGGG
ncbi:MAG: hypothetical protein MAG551_02486 [Candidatus Scalindua arabica]|uniref:Cytochrome c n=1 Tax=Candidatus Scalindua arabica TaxID=1127984 RepID=A0A941W5X2_9BACT|nr:hypothetical protein [Candidatus Scalindua arabica]